jgi:hypothetical protein
VPPDTIAAVVGNTLHHDWALPTLLGIFAIPLAQAAFYLLTRKTQEVTGHYLAVREVLAGVFRSSLLAEVKAVFRAVEDLLPALLTQKGPNDERSRFDALSDGLAALDPDDPDAHQELLRDSLAGVLTHRIAGLFHQLEQPDWREEDGRFTPRISFSEATVEEFIFLAGAVQATRRRRDDVWRGQVWSRRLLAAVLFSLAVLTASLLIQARWAYWISIGATSAFLLTSIGCAYACYVGTTGAAWLREMAEHPEALETIRAQLGK